MKDKMKRALTTICTVVFLIVAINAEGANEKALIFDRDNDSPISLSNDVPTDEESGNWAVACPAQTETEDNFVEQYSFTKNALFVKVIYSKGSKVSEVKKHTCEKPLKTAIAYRVKNSTFQFGYEIYFERKDAKHFSHYDYKDYRAPKDVIGSLKTRFRRGKFYAKEYSRIVSSALGIGVTKLWLNSVKMDFMWLYLFKVRFDLSKKILKLTWHEIQPNSKWIVPQHGEQCNDYNLGLEVYEGIDVDALYNNQANIFDMFELPPNTCESADQCFMKWSLVPVDQFGLNFTKPLSCSNLPTIPIWKKRVEMVLKKLDNYLYALFRVLKEPALVISGIYGEQEISNKNSEGKSTLFLETKKEKIPVPKIIYKAVEYELKTSKSRSSRWYSAVIVIHNDPFFKPSDKLCSKDKTQTWGWQEITKDAKGNLLDFIYVCSNNISLQRRLPQLSGAEASGLNLLTFEFSDGSTKSIKVAVDEMYGKLSSQNYAVGDFNTYHNIEKLF